MSTDSKGFSWSEPGIGKLLAYNFVFLLGGVCILTLLEKRVGFNLLKALEETMILKNHVNYSEANLLEKDVKEESERVDCGGSNLKNRALEEPLLVSHIGKLFKKNGRPFFAVNNLTFGVLPTECFGLLGLNGAGKTTTLQILTGETNASRGEAYVNGYNIQLDRYKSIRNLGFCPQFDYLPEFLTVRQSLELFANIRGISSSFVPQSVRNFLDAFNLHEFRDRVVQNLSGGNKRKTSSAIAFIGQPKTIILDEVCFFFQLKENFDL